MNTNTWKNRAISVILAAVMLVFMLPANGFAKGIDADPILDIADGFIIIKDGTYMQYKSDKDPRNSIRYSGEITITGTQTSGPYNVFVSGGQHTIRLRNAAIAPKAQQDNKFRIGIPPLQFEYSTVNLILEGNNTLTGSSMYSNEYAGRNAVELGGSTVTVSGAGTLNVFGGNSLRQIIQADVPAGGKGIWLQAGSTFRVSDPDVTLNITGGNGTLDRRFWGDGLFLRGDSRMELADGTMSAKGSLGFYLCSSSFSQSGGKLSINGVQGIRLEDNAQAEISGGSAEVSGYKMSACSGNLSVSGGDVTLCSDNNNYSSTMSLTVSPPPGFYGNMKNGGSSSSYTQMPIAEKTTLNSGFGKYVNITFSDEKHNLCVQDGGTGSGSYLPGQKVEISAGSKAGQAFNWWEAVSGDGRLLNAINAETFFIMGYQDAVIKPVFVTGEFAGDFVVATEEENGWSYENGVLTVSGGGIYKISMRMPDTVTDDRIVIGAASPTVFLNGVQIKSTDKSKPAIELKTGSPTVILNGVQIESSYSAIALPMTDWKTTNATLKLSGENKVSFNGYSSRVPAISVCHSNPSKVKMTITSLEGDGSTAGRLEATGKIGIGYGGAQKPGEVTINGGTIVAAGQEEGYGYGLCNVTVNGGDVTAKGAQDAFMESPRLYNDPSIQVEDAFVHTIAKGISNQKPVHIYYDKNGGSSVKSVSITPESTKVSAGDTVQFVAQVEGGGNADKTVTWSVTGGVTGTSIDENGLLTVAEGETAQTLTVTASNTYSGRSEKVSVSVWQRTYNLTTQVNGGHGTISESKSGLAPNSTETVAFTPENGYMVDTVTVNGVEVSVSGNTLSVTMDADKTVIAAYKEISHTHGFDKKIIKDEALKTPADCTHNAVYFKSCSCGGVSTTETFEAANTMLGHKWGGPDYAWAEDGKSCTARRVCKNNSSHIETADATVTSKVTTPATGTTNGETTYTAAYAEDWAATQTKVIADIPSAGSETQPTGSAGSSENKPDNNATTQTKVNADLSSAGSETQPTDSAGSSENKPDNNKSPQTGDNSNMSTSKDWIRWWDDMPPWTIAGHISAAHAKCRRCFQTGFSRFIKQVTYINCTCTAGICRAAYRSITAANPPVLVYDRICLPVNSIISGCGKENYDKTAG